MPVTTLLVPPRIADRVKVNSLQTHHVCSTLKRRGNARFHVVSTWNTHGVFVGLTFKSRKKTVSKRQTMNL